MLNFIGNGSAFNLDKGSNGAYFTIDKVLFVIDSGETTLRSLSKLVDFQNFETIHYLITHLHNDHVGSLASTVSYMYLELEIKINIIHPNNNVVKLLELMGVEKHMYNYYMTKKYTYENTAIDFIETHHVSNMDCFGLLISKQDSNIYYSGDANSIPEQILKGFLSREIKTLYQDTCLEERSGNSHMYYKNLLKVIPEELLSQVYCMHLESGSKQIFATHGLQCVTVN